MDAIILKPLYGNHGLPIDWKLGTGHIKGPVHFAVLQKIKKVVRVWIMAGAKHLAIFMSHPPLQF
jgi:hypothetical protein